MIYYLAAILGVTLVGFGSYFLPLKPSRLHEYISGSCKFD